MNSLHATFISKSLPTISILVPLVTSQRKELLVRKTKRMNLFENNFYYRVFGNDCL